MRRIILVGIGVVLVTLGLLYGPVGFFTSSISERTDSIARWQEEQRKDIAAFEAYSQEVKAMGDLPATVDGQQDYAYAVERLEYQANDIRVTGEMIDHERSRKTQQIIITSVFVGAGLLAVGLGLVLGRRKRTSTSTGVPVAVAHPAL